MRAVRPGRADRPPLSLADDQGRPAHLSLADLMAVARQHRPVEPLDTGVAPVRALERAMLQSVAWIADLWKHDPASTPTVYGINTGFGALSGRATLSDPAEARELMRNLILSHSAGVGAPLDEEVVRAAMLIRARQLAAGSSGIRPEVVNRLIAMLNLGVWPIIPRMGSLGASGDLAPLAHLALAISRAADPSGEPAPSSPVVWVRAGSAGAPDPPDPPSGPAAPPGWREVSADVALAPAGGRVILEAKEGLALTNGASVSAALAALVADGLARLLAHAELATAMVLEAVRGFRDPFLPALVAARPYPGALRAAAAVLGHVAGSARLDRASGEIDPERVPPQDFYSLRCAPQVLGAGWDALAFAQGTILVEINSAVDNPLILMDLPRAYKAVSGGNFHGAPLGYALDLLKVVATDVASMSERRTFRLTDHRTMGSRPGDGDGDLPAFLIRAPEGREGLHSGLMVAQYTAASLVSACKTLAHPDSVDSIPSSAGQEDHVSMSMNAGLRAREILDMAFDVVAIELLSAAQAMDLGPRHLAVGRGTGAALARLRQSVPFLSRDRVISADIAAVRRLMDSGALLGAVAEGVGA